MRWKTRFEFAFEKTREWASKPFITFNWCRIFASTLDSKGGSSKVKRTRSISERRGLVEGQSSHTPSKSKASHHTEHQASSSHATNVKHPQKDLLSSNEQTSLLQRADTIKLCSLEAFFCLYKSFLLVTSHETSL